MPVKKKSVKKTVKNSSRKVVKVKATKKSVVKKKVTVKKNS
jgi:hypothetical protein